MSTHQIPVFRGARTNDNRIRTKLVTVFHAAAHFGGVNPVEDIGNWSPAAAYVEDYLHKRAVNVSSMGYYDAPLDCAARKIRSVLRLAPHYYNTEDETRNSVRISRPG